MLKQWKDVTRKNRVGRMLIYVYWIRFGEKVVFFG